MARVMMLVSEEGATLAETRAGGPSGDGANEAALRDEALTYGFSEDEVRSAKFVVVGAF